MTDHRDIVAIGASAGGVEALQTLVAGLPAGFPGAVLVVLHVPRDAPSALPGILDRAGPLSAATAEDGEPLRPGHIYVAPNDRHLIALDGHVRLTRGPAENGHRPAVDPLFRSVARAFGRRAIGVVLSGSRDDGAAGLAAIVARGGAAVVQDPSDALYPWMPRAAIEAAPTDHIAPAGKLGGLIAELTAMDLPDSPPTTGGDDRAADDRAADDLLDAEVRMSELGSLTSDELTVPPSGYGCPSCGGALFQFPAGPVPRFRCRVGHAWSAESLLDEQAIALEGALWMALRALEEKSALSRRMASHRTGGERFHDVAAEAEAAGVVIRQLINQIGSAVPQDHDHPREVR